MLVGPMRDTKAVAHRLPVEGGHVLVRDITEDLDVVAQAQFRDPGDHPAKAFFLEPASASFGAKPCRLRIATASSRRRWFLCSQNWAAIEEVPVPQPVLRPDVGVLQLQEVLGCRIRKDEDLLGGHRVGLDDLPPSQLGVGEDPSRAVTEAAIVAFAPLVLAALVLLELRLVAVHQVVDRDQGAAPELVADGVLAWTGDQVAAGRIDGPDHRVHPPE